MRIIQYNRLTPAKMHLDPSLPLYKHRPYENPDHRLANFLLWKTNAPGRMMTGYHPPGKSFLSTYTSSSHPEGLTAKSLLRCRWRELRDWEIDAKATRYWELFLSCDKDHVHSACWSITESNLTTFMEPFSSESSLGDPFSASYRGRAITRVSGDHTVMQVGGW